MLPQSLLCLLSASLVLSQSLALNSLTQISPTNLPNPPIFSLPNSNNLTVSIALCSDPPTTNPPKFTLSNGTTTSNPQVIQLTNGHGNWTGKVDSGTLRIENGDNLKFEIGISDSGGCRVNCIKTFRISRCRPRS